MKWMLPQVRRPVFWVPRQGGSPVFVVRDGVGLARVALPAELRPYFEQPLNAVGDIDILWETSETPNHGRHCRHLNTVTIGTETLKAYGADRHMLHVIKQAPVSGIRLGNLAVIQDSSMRVLMKGELEAAEILFSVADIGAVDPVTHEPTRGDHAALIAGNIYQFESAEVFDHVEQVILEAKDTAEKNQVATPGNSPRQA